MSDHNGARRALVLTHSAGLGGAELGLVDLLSFAPQEFFTVLLEHGPLEKRLFDVGAECEVLDVPSITGKLIGPAGWRRVGQVLRVALGLRRQLEQVARREGCDVVVLNSLRALLLVGICGRPRGLRCVAIVQDGLCQPYLPFLQMVAARTALRRIADLAVANSGWTASKIPPGVRSVVVPSLSGRRFFELPLDPAARNEWPSKVKVLLLARLVEWKGQLRLLERIDEVGAVSDWSLTLAGGAWFGEEAYRDRVHARAAAIERPVVQLTGHVDDVVALVDDHDVVLHASTVPEPFGQVVVQAMARGKAVIVAEAGGAADFVSTGGCLGFDPDRPEQLHELLCRIIDDSGERRRWGALARDAARRFDPRRLQSDLRYHIFDQGQLLAKEGCASPSEPATLSVAVILASAGRPALLADVLRDCAAQEDTSFSGIVSVPDEASLPDDRTLLEGWQVVSGTRGLAAQRNAGMAALDPHVDVVVFFDDDAVPRADFLRRTVDFFRTHPDVVGLTGQVLLDGKISGEIDRETAVSALAASFSDGAPSSWRLTQELYGANFAFRRQVAPSLGFDEQLPLYSWLEDYDFARRLARYGHLAHVDDCVIVHRAAASGGRTNHIRLGYSQVMNPIHLVRTGSFPVWLAMHQISRPLAKNLALAIAGRSRSWRRQRLRGNGLAAFDAVRGRVTPGRIVHLRAPTSGRAS